MSEQTPQKPAKCPSCGIINFSGETDCKRCGASLTVRPSATTLPEHPGPAGAFPGRPCPQCAGPVVLVSFRPDNGLGLIVGAAGLGIAVAGFLTFNPAIWIDVAAATGPLLIVALFLAFIKTRGYLHCRSCGRRFPW